MNGRIKIFIRYDRDRISTLATREYMRNIVAGARFGESLLERERWPSREELRWVSSRALLRARRSTLLYFLYIPTVPPGPQLRSWPSLVKSRGRSERYVQADAACQLSCFPTYNVTICDQTVDKNSQVTAAPEGLFSFFGIPSALILSEFWSFFFLDVVDVSSYFHGR